MPVTRSRAKRLAEQPPPPRTPARSTKTATAYKTPAASPFSMTAASPVALKIRQQILGGINASSSDENCRRDEIHATVSSKTPMKHDNDNAVINAPASHSSPMPPAPRTARRARYEQAKRRFGDKLGLPAASSSTVNKSPSSTTKSNDNLQDATEASDENATIHNKISSPPVCLISKTRIPSPSPPKKLIEASKPEASSRLLVTSRGPQSTKETATVVAEPAAATTSSSEKTPPPPRKSEVLSAKLAKRALPRTTGSSLPKPKVAAIKTTTTTAIAAKKLSPPPSETNTQTKRTGAATTKPTLQRKKQTPLSIQTTTKSPVNRSSAAADTGATTRRNLDKRTARLLYAKQFADDISNFDWTGSSSVTTPKASTCSNPNSAIRVIVRKRPLFDHESAAKEFDIVRIKDDQTVCIFDTKLQADMKTRLVQPVTFSCNHAYDETATSRQVYDESIKSLVHSTIAQNKAATILMFGQTGSGKSYTCSAIEEFVAQDIFDDAVSSSSSTASATKLVVQVKCIEITKKCTDLLGHAKEVKLMDCGSTMQFRGATLVTVKSVKEFQSVLQMAKDARATHCTDKNDVSSRSHAVFQITIHRDGNTKQPGVLTLVDCAGTERRNDSMHHNKERQAESAEINASLYALKQCIRAKMMSPKSKSPMHIPFRASNLTRSLRDCLEQPEARLLVIATLAPTATDTEHSIETLRTVMDLMGATTASASAPADDETAVKSKATAATSEAPVRKLSTSPRINNTIAPKNWNHDQLEEFLKAKRLLSPTAAVPATMGGREIMRLAKPQLRHAFFAHDDANDAAPKVDALFQSLRAETDRIARLDFKRRCAQAKAGNTAA